jgi:hypothetical protein
MENTNSNQPRVVNITRTQIATFIGFGWSRDQIAKALDITPKDVFRVMRDFGFYKQKESTAQPSYVINLIYDEPVIQNQYNADQESDVDVNSEFNAELPTAPEAVEEMSFAEERGY